MSEKASWTTSTLSQAFICSLIFYGGMILLVAGGVIWKGLDVQVAEKIIGWVTALEAPIATAYLAVRKTGNGTNTPPEAPKP